ncbi:hypothetical protein M378DRAFT_824454 [Amanita muscaria Koide BX008]|uniref:Uncharacterized protein n=1 Tax=Amanita muscaria (strain Koide BX008) TaxID=946122 RepID=A0A0C2X3I2_AMAMK|nr:hypothetical protein M378DRAFT_824454 [Amanita muscaria Koide BX008]
MSGDSEIIDRKSRTFCNDKFVIFISSTTILEAVLDRIKAIWFKYESMTESDMLSIPCCLIYRRCCATFVASILHVDGIAASATVMRTHARRFCIEASVSPPLP